MSKACDLEFNSGWQMFGGLPQKTDDAINRSIEIAAVRKLSLAVVAMSSEFEGKMAALKQGQESVAMLAQQIVSASEGHLDLKEANELITQQTLCYVNHPEHLQAKASLIRN